MITRNYKIYKVLDNIYAQQTSVSTRQLLKLTFYIVSGNLVLLILWLLFTQVQLKIISVSTSASMTVCDYGGRGQPIFSALFIILISLQLILSIFLTIKTKSFGGGYSLKFNEHKQLGLSV